MSSPKLPPANARLHRVEIIIATRYNRTGARVEELIIVSLLICYLRSTNNPYQTIRQIQFLFHFRLFS